jgi:hypothetical protein
MITVRRKGRARGPIGRLPGAWVKPQGRADGRARKKKEKMEDKSKGNRKDARGYPPHQKKRLLMINQGSFKERVWW